MTPKRTAHPVARKLAERPATPPLLLPLEPPELVGDGELEDLLLLVREDRWEATLEALDWTEDKLEVREERTEEAGKPKSTSKIRKRK
jgi:hypothetical protein